MPPIFDEKNFKEKYSQFLRDKSEFKDFLDPNIFPCIEYHSEGWLKPRVNTLFIAESPPWSDIRNNKDYVYFYNENFIGKSHCLADHIFKDLGISGNNRQEKLKQFSDMGFFLTDTIKCILNKKILKETIKGKKHQNAVLIEIARFSAVKILKNEIERINPDYIVVIGKTALESIKIISEDTRCEHLRNAHEDLTNINRYKDISSPEMFANYHLYFVPFPNSLTLSNKHNGELFSKTFEKLREISK